MTINKVLTSEASYVLSANKTTAKKIQQEPLASFEKVDSSISVESKIDTDRLARLDKLAEQIKNKTFSVSPDAIAQKMVDDRGLINLLIN